MKFTRCALFLLTAIASVAQQGVADEELGGFGLDEFYYVPKFTLNVGFRGISGAKSTFSGQSAFQSAWQDIGDLNAGVIRRTYHDGIVDLDTRFDLQGNPLNDGLTNAWSFASDKQALADGTMAFHSYAVTVDPTSRSQDPDSSYGAEVTVARDMGKLGRRIEWKLLLGASVNRLESSLTDTVTGRLTTITDIYSLEGRPAPEAPYSGPRLITAQDANGNSILIDTSVMLSNNLLARLPASETAADISTRWRLSGAYFTFRVGPSFTIAITAKLRATIGAGGAVVYAGSTYTVENAYTPETGGDFNDFVSDGVSVFLPGYYADASMEYLLTERTGFYLGAAFQSTGDYTQNVTNGRSDYSTRIDMSGLQGFRAGLTYRF